MTDAALDLSPVVQTVEIGASPERVFELFTVQSSSFAGGPTSPASSRGWAAASSWSSKGEEA